MTITAAAPLAGSNLPAASIRPLVSTEMMLAIEPRSAAEALVSGSGGERLGDVGDRDRAEQRPTPRTRRRCGGPGPPARACSKWSIAASSPIRSMPTRGVGVERALEMREPAADVLVEEVAQEHAQARDLDAPRELPVARADGQDGRQLVGDLQRRAEALEQVRERDRRRRRDEDHAASRTRSAPAGDSGRRLPAEPFLSARGHRCRLSCSRDRRGNGSVDPCPHGS